MNATMSGVEAFTKVVRLGKTDTGFRVVDVFCSIKWDGAKLSITGVEGPRKNGDAWGSCGQIVMGKPKIKECAPGWTLGKVARFWREWSAWHMNDMRAGCEHQRAEKWAEYPIYPDQPTRAYVKHPGGAMGWNMLTWLPANKGGLMSMPCDKCGYKFGTAWLKEDVPTDVLAWLRGLPDTDTTPAWV